MFTFFNKAKMNLITNEAQPVSQWGTHTGIA